MEKKNEFHFFVEDDVIVEDRKDWTENNTNKEKMEEEYIKIAEARIRAYE